MIQENIIFKVRTKDHKMGIVILNPKLGNYKYTSPPDLNFEKGERIEFMCPICCEHLSGKESNKDLVDIILVDEFKHESHVFFSSLAGEHTILKTETRV